MNARYPLDRERLDVYRLAVEFAAWAGELIDRGPLKVRKISSVKHLDDSARSIVNNIAEGNGKRSMRDRCRFFDIARGAALECASCLDVLVARKRLPTGQALPGKAMLVRIVAMLSKLVERLLGRGSLAERNGGAGTGGPERTSAEGGARARARARVGVGRRRSPKAKEMAQGAQLAPASCRYTQCALIHA